jgi:UDP-N-acetyl-D-glucosamine dehydrogenase
MSKEISKIESFLEKNKGKKVIVVQGLGFVGAVMSIVCANAIKGEYAVIGVDLPTKLGMDRINKINSGEFPITSSDPKIEEYFQASVTKCNLLATYSEYAYSKADVIIVDINLDVKKDKSDLADATDMYEVDMSPFNKAVDVIARNCKEDVLVLVETTVPPGTCKNFIAPAIKNQFEIRDLDFNKIKIGHSYERVMPGPNYIDSIQNFYRVYSGINSESADAVENFLETIIKTDHYPLTRLQSTTATETAKVLENAYRAMNIAFVVEWSRFAENSGVNLYEIVDAIRLRPTHANLMYPGIGVGGYCLTKDPLLASWASQNLFTEKLKLNESEKAVKINDSMPSQAFEYLKKSFKLKLDGKKVLILGVSYRGNVADTRFSPVEVLYQHLVNEGAVVWLSDPYVKYWDELKMSIDSLVDAEKLKEADIIIYSTYHNEYKLDNFIFENLLNYKGKFIFDTIGVLSNEKIKKLTSLHTVKVLGRGDI